MRGTGSFQRLSGQSSRLSRHGPPRPFSPSKSLSVQVQRVVVNKQEFKPATSTILNNPDLSETTALVDGLLSFTRELMNGGEPEPSLIRHVVAFSGGIDSSLVLALLKASQGDQDTIHAVIGRSSALPQDQLLLARQVADHIGVPLMEVATTEGTDETYIANTGQACLACKTHLYSALQAVVQHAETSTHPSHHRPLLYNGTNADDLRDSTRVGLIAARTFSVRSPLLNTAKTDVRRAARHLGLPNWNVAASPCLRSRLALGVQATQDHLHRIEAAESFVKRRLSSSSSLWSETSNLRVRLLAGNRAMVEVDAPLLDQVKSHLADWHHHFVHHLAFSSVDARPFQSGSVAKTVKQ